MGKQCRWTLTPPPSHQACLALLFFYLTFLIFGFSHQQLQTFPFWPVWCSPLAPETVCLVCAVEMVNNSVCGGSNRRFGSGDPASCFLWTSQPDQCWWPLNIMLLNQCDHQVCVCKTTHIKVESWTVRLCQWKHFHKHWVSCNSFEFQQLQKK